MYTKRLYGSVASYPWDFEIYQIYRRYWELCYEDICKNYTLFNFFRHYIMMKLSQIIILARRTVPFEPMAV